METIRLNDPAVAALTAAKQVTAVLDAGGRVVGFFAPVGEDHAADYAQAAAQAFTRRQARAADPGPRYTTPEVLTHLASLGK